MENIKNKRLTRIDSAQFCGPLGAEAMRLAYEILQGHPVPAHSEVPTFPITQETLSTYPGWMGPIPQQFTKPWQSDDKTWFGVMNIVEEQ